MFRPSTGNWHTPGKIVYSNWGEPGDLPVTGDWDVMTCTPTEFRVHARLDAFEGAVRVRSRNWDVAVPRNLV